MWVLALASVQLLLLTVQLVTHVLPVDLRLLVDDSPDFLVDVSKMSRLRPTVLG